MERVEVSELKTVDWDGVRNAGGQRQPGGTRLLGDPTGNHRDRPATAGRRPDDLQGPVHSACKSGREGSGQEEEVARNSGIAESGAPMRGKQLRILHPESAGVAEAPENPPGWSRSRQYPPPRTPSLALPSPNRRPATRVWVGPTRRLPAPGDDVTWYCP